MHCFHKEKKLNKKNKKGPRGHALSYTDCTYNSIGWWLVTKTLHATFWTIVVSVWAGQLVWSFYRKWMRPRRTISIAQTWDKMYRFSLLLTKKTALFSLNNLFFIATVSHRRRRDISTKLRTAWNVTTIWKYHMYLLVSVKLSVRTTGFDHAQSSSNN